MTDATTAARADWIACRAPAARCELRHPPDWTPVEGLFGTLVAIVAPGGPHGAFRSNLNVVLQPRGAGDDADGDLAAQQLVALEAVLSEPHVLESETVRIAGRGGGHALVAHRDRGLEITLEQWLVEHGDGFLVLSASALTAAFGFDGATMREIAATLSCDG